MADPTNIDTSLYRMKVYAKLLAHQPERTEIAADLQILINWIEYARPLLGNVTDIADQRFEVLKTTARHGYMAQQLAGLADPKPKPEDEPPPDPDDAAVDPPPAPPPAEAPTEDKPVA